MSDLTETKWSPETKVVAAAVATLVAWAAQTWGGIDVPPGVEAAFAVVVAYFVPNR